MVVSAVHNMCGTFGEHPVQAGSWGHRGTRAHLQQSGRYNLSLSLS